MTGKKVLIAGATGYLGQYLLKEAKKQGYWVRALTRDSNRLSHLSSYIDDLFIGEITNPDSLVGVCKDIDVVISAVGITKQKDGFTYMDVDYQGNKNLLDCALSDGVSKFIYISVFNAQSMRSLKIIQAKEQFARELSRSSLDHTIIRPTGFFSDMAEFLKMATNGRGYVFGSGEQKINPIHGEDLAKVCIEEITSDNRIVDIGGPEILTYNQILSIAFDAAGKKPKISKVPIWMRNVILKLARLFTSVKTYGPLEFFMTVLAIDMVAPIYGSRHLQEFFIQNCE